MHALVRMFVQLDCTTNKIVLTHLRFNHLFH